MFLIGNNLIRKRAHSLNLQVFSWKRLLTSDSEYRVIPDQVDKESPIFKENESSLRSVTDEMAERIGRIHLGGGEEARARHIGRKKLLPRDRIRKLLDVG